MIAQRTTLDVLPICDHLLEDGATEGGLVGDGIAWSNELVMHVVELKNEQPETSLNGLATRFQTAVCNLNQRLAEYDALLMPGAMHPWMDPSRETVLWPYANGEVYAAFDEVFGCNGHGWANLQSAHLNIAFADEEEFARLHAAVRIILPLLPALSASSPVVDGQPSGLLDTRLSVYRANQLDIPSITGELVPEPIFSIAEYRQLLARIYADIAPYDPAGVLQHEWLNSRGAIARFERSTIEIRTIDVQEHPAADLAVLTAAVSVMIALSEERWSSSATQRALATRPLYELWQQAIRDGDQAVASEPALLAVLGWQHGPVSLSELWSYLVTASWPAGIEANVIRARDVLLDHGPLARRVLTACGAAPDRGRLREVWRELALCLANGSPFIPA
jgi:gamma-glutamyl:cysteine ligase YbdK (ATP-grasp superfamily)